VGSSLALWRVTITRKRAQPPPCAGRGRRLTRYGSFSRSGHRGNARLALARRLPLRVGCISEHLALCQRDLRVRWGGGGSRSRQQVERPEKRSYFPVLRYAPNDERSCIIAGGGSCGQIYASTQRAPGEQPYLHVAWTVRRVAASTATQSSHG